MVGDITTNVSTLCRELSPAQHEALSLHKREITMTDKLVHTASAGHGQDWGTDNLSTAHDQGRVVPPIVYQTPDVTVYDIGHKNDYLVSSGDTNV